MSEPFLGEVKLIAFNFAPQGWALCNGQLLPINQNQALFSLLGTMYGGDGRTTFALPDLQGRAPLNQGQGPGLSNYVVGESGGSETVMLTQAEMPQHTHAGQTVNGRAQTNNPANALPARPSGVALYGAPQNLSAMAPGVLAVAGGGLPHTNMQPYLTLNFIIALQGIYPPRS